MSRPRDLSSSEWFHVVQKGADAQDIFSAPSHRTVYQELVVDAFERDGIELHAYVWMTNHTHLLCRAPDGGLADAMHRLGTRYAVQYNGWTERSGPLFTARYFSEPVRTDDQLVNTARYIHRNPIPIVGSMGLSAYGWSSLGALTGCRDRPSWLASGPVTGGRAPAVYERFVREPQPSDRQTFGNLPPSTPTTCHEIESAVATVTGRSIEDLRKPRKSVRDDARMVMISLAVDCRSATSAELALHFGLSDQRSIRRIARRSRALATQSPSFAALRHRVVAALDESPLAA